MEGDIPFNRLFDELAIGDSASMERTLTAQDIERFARVSGDVNPQHVDPVYAATTPFHGIIGHGMWSATLISALLGTRLPGPGTIYLGQTLRFLAPVRIGDTLTVNVAVSALDAKNHHVTLACTVVNQAGTRIVDGEARVVAPTERAERERTLSPENSLIDARVSPFVEKARALGPTRVGVVHPCDEASLTAAIDAWRCGLIEPVLVGPKAKLEAVAREAGLDISALPIDDVPHSHAAADHAVRLAATGRVDALMKGSLHTDELMGAVVARSSGLRTSRRISHCFLMQVPSYAKPFILTDAAINIAPTLDTKADIVRNAIDLAHIVGVALPRVAILAAVETVNARMPATLDAAALCKMADRGQLDGAIVDGPLAFDNTISAASARIKGIVSPVAGVADILVVPDLESGNLLAKQLQYVGGASSAGVVVGARVPIVLTSRSDSRESRIASCAVASLIAHSQRESGSKD